ncbi:caspase family protein [Streptomyces sp. NBC_01262]|uniref:caspase family protein n=1 Tax=Streptomyces sp. NBC_01262 TaxID=2903803 RepID=UPI002E35DE32|nr:caspase family protein [Streptomyces sp. NBC_01262]
MTEPVLWRDYSRSRAVLIGTWDYDHLASVPAARNSLERMAALLTGPLCGWPTDRVHTVRNARRRGNLPDRLMHMFDGVTDTALFYFTGHGQLHDDELCLALRQSPTAGPRRLTTGLQFSDVRAALRECDAKTKIIILDCCFSGRATCAGNSLAATSADVIDMTLGTGAFTMAASGAYRTAWFETEPGTGRPQTYFTKYLIDTIETGLPDHPDGLPLGTVFARTADALARDRRPEPTRSVRHDADRFILARNAAGSAGPAGNRLPEPEGPPPPDEHPRKRLLARRTLALAGLCAAAALTAVLGLVTPGSGDRAQPTVGTTHTADPGTGTGAGSPHPSGTDVPDSASPTASGRGRDSPGPTVPPSRSASPTQNGTSSGNPGAHATTSESPTAYATAGVSMSDDPDAIEGSEAFAGAAGGCAVWLDDDGSGDLYGMLNTSYLESCNAVLHRNDGLKVSLSASFGAERTSAISDVGHTMWICVWEQGDSIDTQQCSARVGMHGDTPRVE